MQKIPKIREGIETANQRVVMIGKILPMNLLLTCFENSEIYPLP